MNKRDAQRIVRARALMWDAASGGERAEWLRRADEVYAELEATLARPAMPTSASERTS